MDKENVAYINDEVLLFSYKEQSYVICRKMDGNRDHYFDPSLA
jgi:hypothetical protein